MPFGLTNTPATFQALMNTLFSPYLKKFILVFFDDILIYSAIMEEHVDHLRAALTVLRENNLVVKRSKSAFAVPQVEYLGHIISGAGVATDPTKIQAIQCWPILKSVTQLRGFLGLTSYYRRFVHQYGLLCRPLHDLLKKNSFSWTEQRTLAISTLKAKMSSAPILALPNFNLLLTIETDASGGGIGVVLMQQGKPLAFYSQALGPRASAQSTYHKEAMDILQALKR
jgi:hypothetical protein